MYSSALRAQLYEPLINGEYSDPYDDDFWRDFVIKIKERNLKTPEYDPFGEQISACIYNYFHSLLTCSHS